MCKPKAGFVASRSLKSEILISHKYSKSGAVKGSLNKIFLLINYSRNLAYRRFGPSGKRRDFEPADLDRQQIKGTPATISYPDSSGFWVSGATLGRLWGHRKNSIFLIGCSVTFSIVLPQKSCGNKIRCPQSLPGVAPLTKKPEDSGYEIAPARNHELPALTQSPQVSFASSWLLGETLGYPLPDVA